MGVEPPLTVWQRATGVKMRNLASLHVAASPLYVEHAKTATPGEMRLPMELHGTHGQQHYAPLWPPTRSAAPIRCVSVILAMGHASLLAPCPCNYIGEWFATWVVLTLAGC